MDILVTAAGKVERSSRERSRGSRTRDVKLDGKPAYSLWRGIVFTCEHMGVHYKLETSLREVLAGYGANTQTGELVIRIPAAGLVIEATDWDAKDRSCGTRLPREVNAALLNAIKATSAWLSAAGAQDLPEKELAG